MAKMSQFSLKEKTKQSGFQHSFSLYSSGWPLTHRDSICPLLLSAGIEGMCHHTQKILYSSLN